MKTFIISLLNLAFCASLFAQNYTEQQPSVRIAQYKDDKSCAISYTFDDGNRDQYTHAVPMLDKHNFKGTFWIIGARISEDENKQPDHMTWAQLKALSNNGHEVSNHSWTHPNLAKIPLADAREEISKTDKAIEEHIGILPRTFCYPYNATNEEVTKLASENRVATRTHQYGFGTNTTKESFAGWLKMLIASREWGVAMIHGIIKGYDAFQSPDVLSDHLDDVALHKDEVWVGTFHDVASYIKERENTKLEVKYKKNKIICTPEMSLNTDLFNIPLTLIIDTVNIHKVKAVQNKKKLPVVVKADKVCIEFMPSEGVIEIHMK